MAVSYRVVWTRGTGEVLDTPPEKKGLQHSLNNPLAALLAELQLLEMEDLQPDHRESVERALTLTRRLIQIVRERVPPHQI